MWGGIRRESVAVMMRIITSLNHTASIVARNAVATRDRERVARMAGKGSCESVRNVTVQCCLGLLGVAFAMLLVLLGNIGMGCANKILLIKWHDLCLRH